MADVFDGVAERETKTKDSKDSKQNTVAAVRGTNDFLGVVSQLGAALYAHEFRLPPYFARVLRALAALEGVAVGVDKNFKVIEYCYPYVLARLVRDPDPETRETLKRLVLAPDGESVRWRRVARVSANQSHRASRSWMAIPRTPPAPTPVSTRDVASSGRPNREGAPASSTRTPSRWSKARAARRRPRSREPMCETHRHGRGRAFVPRAVFIRPPEFSYANPVWNDSERSLQKR